MNAIDLFAGLGGNYAASFIAGALTSALYFWAAIERIV